MYLELGEEPTPPGGLRVRYTVEDGLDGDGPRGRLEVTAEASTMEDVWALTQKLKALAIGVGLLPSEASGAGSPGGESAMRDR